ncbi:MAG: cell division protein FtsA [Candidatus Levybacteria bacterium CG_4_9_14_3_um_filter_35_16]|nr:MAG: cell division protein FtsA [Candidatus Levybacteria bacterium CG22_combo_CG10-13_8_21_14_all_35_11]PIY94848.1 MAG: cell division protein FtsA [Candidatus Levybacteria bacterium CG_4_10_14_0_8_um_filter_35_23]PJA91281.1 MAG: cell division protein FtsA [Candidatus Levybacteria bacterium CG_4_9_14_3_um_filter_35_16]PJC54276.1 MAG: cell division protein FtsA [Candidatus Levybacteria bacterium CG_4_9_14_0_2_um_filter_35_21]
MTEGKIVVGVDIGTSKIVSLIARINEVVNVLGVSEVKSSGIKKGQIVDIEDAVTSINNSLESAERMAGYSASKVVISIGGGHIESQNSRGVVAVSHPDGEITENDLARVIDAAKAISLPSTREIIHVLPRSYTVDGQEGIKDPIGMTGIRLEVDTHIISASSTAIRNLERAFSEVGVDVDAVVFSGYASSLSALSDTEKELGVVLIDIGAGTIDISVFVEGSVAYSAVLPIGARHITNDLAIGLRISLESAEKIKLHLSDLSGETRRVTQETTDRKNTDEIDLGSLNLPEEISKVSYKTLVDGIIRPRLNEIFTFIGLEIKKSGYAGQIPSGLVITGGGANTVGIKEAARRMLAMPVRIGSPVGIKGIIDEIQSSSFPTVVGLVKYGGSLDGKTSLPFGFSLPNLSGLKFNKSFSKIISFLKSFIP